MGRRLLVFAVIGAMRLLAQGPCANTPIWTPCEITLDLSEADARAHPNPYVTVSVQAEFRSPRFRTFMLPAYWDGGRRLVVRFTPSDPGEWTYRLTGNIASLDGKTGSFTAAAADNPGYIQPANVHHWAYVDDNVKKPHLWMGATALDFATMEESRFRQMADARASQKFNHVRGLLLPDGDAAKKVFPTADTIHLDYFQELDKRIAYLNGKGIIADLVLAGANGQLTALFPSWQQRERFIRYAAARYAAMNVTWQGIRDFESYPDARALLKEIGTVLKQADPYGHPRTTDAGSTSGPVLDDGWENFVSYGTADDQLGSIEHQVYAVPFVNLHYGTEGETDADTMRHRLWNAAMDGQYPTFASTAPSFDSPGARQMTVWYDFFAGTRHWDLEPYFDVDGGRALALESVEYIIYVEKPGPVEVLVEKHGYDVAWINPITGERIKQKGFKGEHFTGEPPDRSHDWLLHISREGHKEGMLRSYKFEARPVVMQEVERNLQKVPFDVEQPAGDLSLSKPAPFAAAIKRETRATRSMMFLWTGEVAAGGEGYRVLATGQKGTLRVPPGIAKEYPAVMDMRIYGMNANGKVYSMDKTYTVTK